MIRITRLTHLRRKNYIFLRYISFVNVSLHKILFCASDKANIFDNFENLVYLGYDKMTASEFDTFLCQTQTIF